jgi:hypothetical protein
MFSVASRGTDDCSEIVHWWHCFLRISPNLLTTFFSFFFFWDKMVAQSDLEFTMQPGWPQTHDPLASASLMLRLQVCTTMPDSSPHLNTAGFQVLVPVFSFLRVHSLDDLSGCIALNTVYTRLMTLMSLLLAQTSWLQTHICHHQMCLFRFLMCLKLGVFFFSLTFSHPSPSICHWILLICFQTQCKIWLPPLTPQINQTSLGLINLLEWLTELTETLTFISLLQRILYRMQMSSQMKRDMTSSDALSSKTLPLNSYLEALQTLSW